MNIRNLRQVKHQWFNREDLPLSQNQRWIGLIEDGYRALKYLNINHTDILVTFERPAPWRSLEWPKL